MDDEYYIIDIADDIFEYYMDNTYYDKVMRYIQEIIKYIQEFFNNRTYIQLLNLYDKHSYELEPIEMSVMGGKKTL